MQPPSLEHIRKELSAKGITETVLADGTGILLDLQGHQVLTLNATGVFIVQTLRASDAPLSTLRDALAQRYDIPADTAEADLFEFLTELERLIT